MSKPELNNVIRSESSEIVSTKKYYQDRIFAEQFKIKILAPCIEKPEPNKVVGWIIEPELRVIAQWIEPFNKTINPRVVTLGSTREEERSKQNLIIIKDEIDKANNILNSNKNDIEYSEISESIWNFTKNILRKIYSHRFNYTPPFPKIIFIENSIELRWEKIDKYKLVLEISDHIKDGIGYVKEKGMSPISGSIRKDRIIDWVLFWIDQLENY